jgi:hypothetical protein
MKSTWNNPNVEGTQQESTDTRYEAIFDTPTPSQLTMPMLFEALRRLGHNSSVTGWETSTDRVDQGIYRKLTKAVLDSMMQLAVKSGSPEAVESVSEMIKDYGDNARIIENPAVQAVLGGELREADKLLLDSKTGSGNMKTLRSFLGEKGWDDFSHNSLARFIREFTDADGAIVHDGAMDRLLSMDVDARNEMYGKRGEALMEKLNKMGQ